MKQTLIVIALVLFGYFYFSKKTSPVDVKVMTFASRAPQTVVKPESKPAMHRVPAAHYGEFKVQSFLQQQTGQAWSFEKNGRQIVSIYGGVAKNLVNTDKKLQDFVAAMAVALGYEHIHFAEAETLRQRSEHETINEFRQQIHQIEVYGAYFRSFRESQHLDGTYFINEFKKYERIESRETYTLEQIEQKYDAVCAKKVFYINDEQLAQLSTSCLIKTRNPVPEVNEVVVSLDTAEILHRRKISIVN